MLAYAIFNLPLREATLQFSLRKNKSARLSQAASLPAPQMNGADLAAVYDPERRFGDYCDFLRTNPHSVLFAIMDVAGHHEENAEIVAAAQQSFRSLGRKLFSGDDINEADATIELALEINQVLMKTARGVHSCPAFLGCYNETLGTLCYSNAGHIPALVRDGASIRQLAATGLPLGLFSHVTPDAPTIALPPAAVLLLVSRGVTEAYSGREELGMARVEQALGRATIASADRLCRDILALAGQFRMKPEREDDLTVLALVRAPQPKQ